MAAAESDLEFEIDRYDPVGRILFRKLGLPVIGVVLLSCIYPVFELLLLPWLEKYRLRSIGETLGYATLTPTIWVYYALSRARIQKLFQQIEDDRIIEERATDGFQQLMERVKRSFGLPIWPLLALVGSSLVAALIYFSVWERQPPPFSSSPWHMRLSFPVFVVNGYVCFLVILRELISIYWLHRLFRRFEINVRPLHPDGAGGLGFIGMHYLGLTLLIVVMGMWLGIVELLEAIAQGQSVGLGWEVSLGRAVYLVLAPASFFVPLWSAHEAMEREKSKLLQEISAQFKLDLDATRSSLNKHYEVIEENLEKVKSLRDMEQLVNETFPTWPYNSQTLRRFSISVLLPIIISMSSALIAIAIK